MDLALKKMEEATSMSEKGQKEVDYDSFLQQMREKLPKQAVDSLTLLQGRLDLSKNSESSPLIYEQMAQIWQQNGGAGPAAFYTEKIAVGQKSDTLWEQTGKKYLIASRMSRDTLLSPWYASKAVHSFEQSIELAEDKSSAKVGLAKTFIEANNEIMRGVFLLREVIAEDSLHTEANLLLGKLSITSKQFEKALVRFNTVLNNDPRNTEAMYYLGEANLGLGNKDAAIAYFEKCKSLVKNPAFREELSLYISRIQKIN